MSGADAIMIKTLERAIEKVKALPPDLQEYAAEVLEEIAASGQGLHRLSEEDRRLVREGLAELDRGEHANQAEVRAVFDKHRK
jgi:predicted transcriptional regulator